MSAFLHKHGVDLTKKEHMSYTMKSDGFMDLIVETWTEDEKLKVSVCHYGKQNGDAMRDPEVVFVCVPEAGFEIPIYYRNDYTGHEQEALTEIDGTQYMKPAVIADLRSFTKTWVRNLKFQGHAL